MGIRHLEVDASLAKESGKFRELDHRLVDPFSIDKRGISEELDRARTELYAPSALNESLRQRSWTDRSSRSLALSDDSSSFSI